MGNDILTGAAYGILVPLAMPFVAYWSRKISYWLFFIVGTLSVPGFAFVSSAIRGNLSEAMKIVLPRIFSFEGVLISLGFGVATIILVGITQLSIVDSSEEIGEMEKSPETYDQEKIHSSKSE